jgi:hypothetical protein
VSADCWFFLAGIYLLRRSLLHSDIKTGEKNLQATAARGYKKGEIADPAASRSLDKKCGGLQFVNSHDHKMGVILFQTIGFQITSFLCPNFVNRFVRCGNGPSRGLGWLSWR